MIKRIGTNKYLEGSFQFKLTKAGTFTIAILYSIYYNSAIAIFR